METMTLQNIFEPQHYAGVRKPLLEAETMPAFTYTSPEFYQREVERIRREVWNFVGSGDQSRENGDYLSCQSGEKMHRPTAPSPRLKEVRQALALRHQVIRVELVRLDGFRQIEILAQQSDGLLPIGSRHPAEDVTHAVLCVQIFMQMLEL